MAEKKPLCIYSGKLKELQSGDTVPDTAHASLTNNPHSVTASQAGAIPEAGSSTDNAIARWDGADGDKLQNSTVTISDIGTIEGLANIRPATDNTYSLGTSSLRWRFSFFTKEIQNDAGSVIYAPNVANATSSVLAAQWHGDYLRRAASSSIRYKHDLTPFDVNLNFDVSLLQMYNFKYKKEACTIEDREVEKEQERRKSAKLEAKTDKEIKEELLTKESEVPQVGMIAENLAQIHPILAVYDKEGRVDAINDVLLPKYNLALIGKLITTVKTQQATIDSLTARLEKLEKTASKTEKS